MHIDEVFLNFMVFLKFFIMMIVFIVRKKVDKVILKIEGLQGSASGSNGDGHEFTITWKKHQLNYKIMCIY